VFDPWLTAAEVVDLARHLSAPRLPRERVEGALARMGLADAAGRRAGTFSRGMLQRLGLAAAVVSEPDLLILDEPCSALDPAGRADVLDLVAELGRTATVLLSTHILEDVQRVCDSVAVLRAGRLVHSGPLDGLLRGRAAPAYEVRLRSAAAPAAARLRREPWVTGVREDGAGRLLVGVTAPAEAEARLPGALADAGARVVSLAPVAPALEDVFKELTA
jgi:ABC-2 type transport system ATP-binding protein